MLPSNYSCDNQMSIFDLGFGVGKMSQESSVPTVEKTSERSSKRSQGSKTRPWLYLNLTSGAMPGWSRVTDGRSHGGCLMQPLWEFHNEEEESSLSQILEDNVPEKYYLSNKACLGILRRSEKRGKTLPEVLRNALVSQAGLSEESFAELKAEWAVA